MSYCKPEGKCPEEISPGKCPVWNVFMGTVPFPNCPQSTVLSIHVVVPSAYLHPHCVCLHHAVQSVPVFHLLESSHTHNAARYTRVETIIQDRFALPVACGSRL